MTPIFAMMSRSTGPEANPQVVAAIGALILLWGLVVAVRRLRPGRAMARLNRTLQSRCFGRGRSQADRSAELDRLTAAAESVQREITSLQSAFALPSNDDVIPELESYRQSIDELERQLGKTL